MNREELEQMRTVNIESIDKNNLVDIRTIHTNEEQPIEERVVSFFAQVKNPYCFLVDDTPVKVRFSENGKSLDETIRGFFIRIKGGF